MSLPNDSTNSSTLPNTTNNTNNTNLTQVANLNPSPNIATILQLIFDKVRTLCKECNLLNLPVKLTVN